MSSRPPSETTAAERLTLWPSLLAVLAVTLLIGLPLWSGGFAYNPLFLARQLLPPFAAWTAGCLLLHLALHRLRHGAWPRPPVERVLSTAAQIGVAFVLVALLTTAYSWGKLLVPHFNPARWDAAVYRLDVALHLGLDPGRVLLALFQGAPWLDAAFDWFYQRFDLLLLGTTAWFVSHPDGNERARYLRGFVLLWLGGLALYLLLPVLGPVYSFPELVPELQQRFPRNYAVEVRLLENYENVAAVLSGASRPVRLEFGIAAMPSLHVALPAYLFLFFHERRNPLRVAFLVTTLLFLIGSVLTGWHYAVDGYAGILLALLCWWAVRRKDSPKASAIV